MKRAPGWVVMRAMSFIGRKAQTLPGLPALVRWVRRRSVGGFLCERP
jgi:hypothetical protein